MTTGGVSSGFVFDPTGLDVTTLAIVLTRSGAAAGVPAAGQAWSTPVTEGLDILHQGLSLAV